MGSEDDDDEDDGLPSTQSIGGDTSRAHHICSARYECADMRTSCIGGTFTPPSAATTPSMRLRTEEMAADPSKRTTVALLTDGRPNTWIESRTVQASPENRPLKRINMT